MRILITGASGFLGSALRAHWARHEVCTLGRGERSDFQWEPTDGEMDATALEGIGTVVHLAGESLGPGRWTAGKKARIRESRIQGTKLLCQQIAQSDSPPKVLLAASGIGFYGDCGDTEVDESAPQGAGFLAELCGEWEEATRPAQEVGVRVVHLRLGIVLGAEGGALAAMRLPFWLGLGGRLGSGQQWMPWIGLADTVRAVDFLMTNDRAEGPVNLVSAAVRNLEFTKALGSALKRPTLLPVPAWGLRLLLGEAAEEMLLSSTRGQPGRLGALGFEPQHRTLPEALAAVL